MKTKALLLTACTLLATVQATAQKRAERLSLENPESFSMILMGDPQSYVKYDINQPVFELTTAWTADNIENLKIKAVLVTGDLVETNDNAVPVRSMANQTSRQMWESVSRSFERLDNKVPYIISPGNHDYGYRSAENGRTCFPEYFPVERTTATATSRSKTPPSSSPTRTGANCSSSPANSLRATKCSNGPKTSAHPTNTRTTALYS